MLSRHDEAIAAIATAPGRGAVGIVRLSGKNLQTVIEAVCGRALSARVATYMPFRDAQGHAIDKGLAIFFPAPHSYTGEDVLELQAHGGSVVLQILLARCLEAAASLAGATATSGGVGEAGLRLARPGEFTERAFLNGKIDLSQAEAIADLIDASTEMAARSAARSLSGAFSLAINGLLARLTRLRMLVEATLDFPEEEIDFLHQADASGQLAGLQVSLSEVMERASQGAILNEGVKIVIAGPPNAGKSSLLNALAGAELAIVTPIAGTTRDKISQLIQIDGVPIHVVDTAGLHAARGEVEKIGIERTWAEIKTADAVLLLRDLAAHPAMSESSGAIKSGADYARIYTSEAENFPKNKPVIEVWNKADLVSAEALADVGDALVISAKTGSGLQNLRQRLLEVAGWHAAPEGLFIARERHVRALAKVSAALTRAGAQLAARHPALDLLAEDLRLAQQHLGEITGAFSADDLLGEIFSRFCIGK